MFSVYEEPEYRRSRTAYRWYCMLEYFINLLVTDIYLFKLLSYTGLSDGTIGLVGSVSTIAAFFQLNSIWLIRKIKHVKRWVVGLCLSGQLVLILLYFLPFLPVGLTLKTVIAFGGISLSYFFTGSVSSILYQWANSYVDPHGRAVYSAEKEMLSLFGGMIFTFLLGIVMDRFELAGNLPGSFLLTIVLGLLMAATGLVCLLCIDGSWKPPAAAAKASGRSASLGPLFLNKGFGHMIALHILWTCAQSFTIGFLGSYKGKELMFSIGAVQIMNILGNMVRFVLSRPMGRFADHTSFAKCIEVALCIAAGAFLSAMFATPSTRWLIAVFTILFAASQAGTGQNFFNILYDYVPQEYFVQASAIRNCIGGVFGFLASLAGSWILGYIQGQNNTLFGRTIYGQQVLAAFSLLLTLLTLFYVRMLLKKPAPVREAQEAA